MWHFHPLILAFLCISTLSLADASVGGYISGADKKKFVQILQNSLGPDEEILNVHYGTSGLKLLGQSSDKGAGKPVCDRLKKEFKSTENLEGTYAYLATWASLGCSGVLHTDSTIKDVKAALEKDKTTTLNIRYALETLNLLKAPIPAPAKVAQLLQARLKDDDSLTSVGHALHAAALLGQAGKFALERVEDVVVQTDEVDGRLLQWEGGLSTTSLLITGLLRLPGANPFNAQQAEKLGNYLLTRKTVQTAKGVLSLLEASLALAGSKVSPVSISVVGVGRATVDKPELKIQVSDLMGQPLKPTPGPVQVQAIKRLPGDVEVMADTQTLTGGSNPTEFSLNLKGLAPGQYQITIQTGPHLAPLPVRVLGTISVDSLEIGLGDTDGTSVPKLTKLVHPGRLSEKLQGDSSQQLVVKFALPRVVHQVFLRLFTEKKEIIFVAEQDSFKVYKVEVNLANELGVSDTYDIELIIGDASVTNPIRWQLGTLEASLGTPDTQPRPTRGPKPEIRHLFRPAEKRPPEPVSLFFTALTAAPLLVLLVLWARIGVNVGNFTVSALPFHAGLGGILGLFALFWMRLDMFTTCAWLIPIGGFTFLTGHKLLSQIAAARTKKQEKTEK